MHQATLLIGVEDKFNQDKNNNTMAVEIKKILTKGVGLNQPTTRITQHKNKIRLPFCRVRNDIANYYVAEVKKTNMELVVDEALTGPIDQTAMWLTGRTKEELETGLAQRPDRKLEDKKLEITDDEKIWLCIMGVCGNGKTTLLKAISEYLKQIHTFNDGKFMHLAPFSFKYVTAVELAEMYLEDRKTYMGIRNTKLLLIDDLGKEPAEILDYGNKFKPMEDMLQYRYNERLGTIFTTNMNRTQAATYYGKRIGDRMLECCKYVVFEGKSFRGRLAQTEILFQ